MMGKAFGSGRLIQYNAKVIDIHQDGGATATSIDKPHRREKRTATADWCRLHVPPPVWPMNVGEP